MYMLQTKVVQPVIFVKFLNKQGWWGRVDITLNLDICQSVYNQLLFFKLYIRVA